MKYAVIIAALSSISLLIVGLYLNWIEDPLKDKFLGFGTIGLFFITFPLFIIWRSNKFDLKKYTWRNESVEDIKKEHQKDPSDH